LIDDLSFDKGEFSFKKQCPVSINKDVEAIYFPKCSLKKENVLDENKEKLILILLTGTNQKGVKGNFENEE
jgi:hypothetical protein